MSFVVRTALDPRSLFEPTRTLISWMNSDLPVSNLKAMDDILHEASAPSRFNMLLLVLFGLLALVLSAVGVYGVISYSVSQRSQEIGIRMALGASRREVGKLVVGEGLVLTLTGLAIGIGASIASTRLMSDLLFGVAASDSLTTVLVAIMLASVSVLACYIPARRAMRVDPMIALRWE
jgi:putative ABC transport system permease protein